MKKNGVKLGAIKKNFAVDVQRSAKVSHTVDAMPPSKPIQIRLNKADIRVIEKLKAKTGLDRTNVIRLALTRLLGNTERFEKMEKELNAAALKQKGAPNH